MSEHPDHIEEMRSLLGQHADLGLDPGIREAIHGRLDARVARFSAEPRRGRRSWLRTHMLLVFATSVVAAGGAAAAATLVDLPGPSYSPGTRPVVAPLSSVSADQLAAVGALAEADGSDAAELPAVAKTAFTIGTLYESGANIKTLVLGASDGHGRRVGVVAARDDQICLVSITPQSTSPHCDSTAAVRAGRSVGFALEEDGSMWFSGVAPDGIDAVAFTGVRGRTVRTTVVKNTYLLPVDTQSGGTLALRGPQQTLRIRIPDSTPRGRVVPG